MKRFLTPTIIFLILATFTATVFSQGRQHRFRHRHGAMQTGISGGTLPTGFNDLFAGSGECLMCHNAQVNQQGQSISIIADWRSTMMANAAKDPFWQAKVSHEGLVNPDHKAVLEDICTRCHAPAGHHNAHHGGQALYSMDEMQGDALALDGVQCTVCHQVIGESLGNFSGQLEIGTEKTIWGPYEDPFPNPMIINVGYTPEYGNHVNDAQLCGGCHTLITNTVDLNGVPTGEEFVEQAIFQEWKNSDHAAAGNTCQQCHVPRIEDPVKISTVPPWLDPRSPFGMHHLAGANVFMSRLLKDFGGQIGVTATAAQFDSTIARSTRLLQQHTLDVSLSEENRTADTLYLSLLLQNKAGHKFPTGYPSRRAFVEILALNQDGDTLFHSGKTDGNFNIVKEDADYEPHQATITSEAQVQIYEMVMSDVNGDVTTVLERAAVHLKDNRIPPTGFTSSHASYDTTQVVGNALVDPDFNHDSGEEGPGSDRLGIHIPVSGYNGSVEATAQVYYQTVNDKWLEHMFGYASDEIDAFKSYYDAADKTPVLVGWGAVTSLPLRSETPATGSIMIYPNPAGEKVYLQFGRGGQKHISLFTPNGKLVGEHTIPASQNTYVINTSGLKGILLLKTAYDDDSAVISKLLVR